MATNFSASLTQASDEANEMYCEECERHGDGHVTAVAFCVDCVEYKCATCQKYHRRQFQNHKLQDSDHMPQDFYFEKCSAHPNQLIKFYCSDCIKEACKECKDNEHVNCSDINHLPTLASDIQKSEEFKGLRKYIDKLKEDIKYTNTLVKAKCEVIDKQEEQATEACKEYKDKLLAAYTLQHQNLIDNFDKKLNETVVKLEKERKDLIQELSEKEKKFEENIKKAETDIIEEVVSTNTNFKSLKLEHLNLVENLKALTVELKHAQNLGQNCKLLIKLKSAKQLCENLHKSIEQMYHVNIQRYKFKISDFQPAKQSSENRTAYFSFEKVSVERRIVFDFDIKSLSNDINSLLVLSEGTLIFSDCAKCSLVICTFVKSNRKYMNDIKFETKPWDITKVSDYEAAVTFPDERHIKLIKFSEDMKVLNTSEIPGHASCFGIAYSNNHLVVSYLFPSSVKILSLSGEIMKAFDKDDNGKDLFSCPYYLTVSPDNTMIYVSDSSTETVTCLNFNGKVYFIYKDDHLKSPNQLVVDEYGSVYVCGYKSNNIHHLSSDLTKVKILIDGRHGIAGHIVSGASLTQASDEANEMYCEECERHGDGHVTAVAFCVDLCGI
ncbi:uncharacterized protein LOC132717736 [Ruditapes philippinarum]|uniref:uncharacterized protein LOC132717736 n=1 Tax=Ruditapes philippinarum TaxID=129788 RepID=UPI00295ABBAC|nr:uncharacterized protein LOC132717736 [Ruditapes philippinarum]